MALTVSTTSVVNQTPSTATLSLAPRRRRSAQAWVSSMEGSNSILATYLGRPDCSDNLRVRSRYPRHRLALACAPSSIGPINSAHFLAWVCTAQIPHSIGYRGSTSRSAQRVDTFDTLPPPPSPRGRVLARTNISDDIPFAVMFSLPLPCGGFDLKKTKPGKFTLRPSAPRSASTAASEPAHCDISPRETGVSVGAAYNEVEEDAEGNERTANAATVGVSREWEAL